MAQVIEIKTVRGAEMMLRGKGMDVIKMTKW